MSSLLIKNLINLYGFTIAKIIFPLITLPYLTRILSLDNYGIIAYVKSIMIYFQLFVDFGFLLSGTKDIVNSRDDKTKLNKEFSEILFARILIGIISLIILIVISFTIDLLKNNLLYTMLSFVNVFLSIFLFDYFYRGIEQMQIITYRFILMKILSTVFTFILVKNDNTIMWIPILDIIASILAIAMIIYDLKKREIKIYRVKIKVSIQKLKLSLIYFLSDFATTAFGALNTLIIGIMLTNDKIALWSVSMTVIGAIMSMYSPIINGIYPSMVKSKNLGIIKKVAVIFLPIIFVGTVITYILSPLALKIIGGEEYIIATNILRSLTPLLFISFISMLVGWPTLGAIDKSKEVTTTTVITAALQIIGIAILIIIGKFDLIEIAILRVLTEIFMLLFRLFYLNKFKYLFNK